MSRTAWLSFLFLVTFTGRAAVTVVTYNQLEIGIDEETGTLVSLSSPVTGPLLEASPTVGGPLDVAYPQDEIPVMRLAARHSKAKVTREAGRTVVFWQKLGSSRPNLPLPSGDVSATLTIRPARDSRSVIFSCRIENRSQTQVPQVLFPDLAGLIPVDGVDRTRLRLSRELVYPFREPLRNPEEARFYIGRGWKFYRAGRYCEPSALRWLDYGSWNRGLSMFQRQWGEGTPPNLYTQRTESDPSHLRLAWEHRADIAAGSTWESGEFWLTPHPGGWAKGIEVFREYVRQVAAPYPLPRHVREGLGFQTVWMIQTAETDPARADFRFSDLPRIAADAREHGIDEIVPWGWCTYSTLPIPIRPELGSEQDLVDGVAKARAMGVNVCPFISVRIVRNKYAGRYGVKPGTSDWTYHQELIPNFQPGYTKFWDGAVVGQDHEEWNREVLETLTNWAKRGVRSFSWDVFTAVGKEGRPAKLIDTIRSFRQIATRLDPAATFSAESTGSLEHDALVADYTWNWIDYVDAAPILNVLRSPRLNANVEDSPRVVKKAFIDGLYINAMPRKPDSPNGTALISSQPAVAAALKQAAGLRRQFLPYFTEGVFLGDSILTEPAEGFVKAHQLPDKLLVLMLNDRAEARMISFESDLPLWLPHSRSYTVRRYQESGQMKSTSRHSGRRLQTSSPLLQPGELAILEIVAEQAQR